MSDRLSRTLTDWKRTLFEVCAFILFVLLLVRFFAHEVWTIVGPLLQ